MQLRLNHDHIVGLLPQTFLGIAGDKLRELTLMTATPGSLELLCKLLPWIYYNLHSNMNLVYTINLMDFTQNPSLCKLNVDFAWKPSLWYAGQTRRDNDARLVASCLSQFCGSELRIITFRILVVATRETLLTQLRHLYLGWFDSFAVPSHLDDVRPDKHEGVLHLASHLQRVGVQLRFSCNLRETEMTRIYQHVRAQLPGLVSRGMLELDTVITDSAYTDSDLIIW